MGEAGQDINVTTLASTQSGSAYREGEAVAE
jgi:hypothetical protein